MSLPTYQPGQAKDYVSSKGWQWRPAGEQLNLRTCPFCQGADYRFYINDATGLWLCHKASCARRGNFYTLQREVGDADQCATIAEQRAEERKARGQEDAPPDGGGLITLAGRRRRWQDKLLAPGKTISIAPRATERDRSETPDHGPCFVAGERTTRSLRVEALK